MPAAGIEYREKSTIAEIVTVRTEPIGRIPNNGAVYTSLTIGAWSHHACNWIKLHASSLQVASECYDTCCVRAPCMLLGGLRASAIKHLKHVGDPAGNSDLEFFLSERPRVFPSTAT